MRRLFIGLCLYLCVISPLGAQQGPNPPTVGPNTLQNAVTANANGSALNTQVAGYGFQAVTFVVSGTFSATVNFEATQDTSKWVSLSCYPTSGGAAVTTATSAGAWRCNLGGAFVQVRARISSYASGSVTVTGASSYQGLASNGQTPLDSIAGAIAAAGTGVLRADSGTASVVGAQWLDLSTCSDGTLVNCVASIGSTTVTTLGVTNVTTVATSATVTSNITLLFLGAGQLSINSGVTVTLNGRLVDPGNVQIFAGSGTVVFGAGSTPYLKADWWGASPSALDATNSTALQATLTALASGGVGSPSVWHIPTGTYRYATALTRTFTANVARITIEGEGWGSALQWNGANDATMLTVDSGKYLGGLTVRDLTFDANSKASTCLSINNALFPEVSRVLFENTKQDAGNTMAALDVQVASHFGWIHHSWFFSLASRGINLNSAASASGPVDWIISNNRFDTITNTAVVGGNIQSMLLEYNDIQNARTNTTAKGYVLDLAGEVTLVGGYVESLYGATISLNPTAAPTTPTRTASIRGVTINNSGASGGDASIILGYTYDVDIKNNSFISVPVGAKTISITTNAVRTRIGRNWTNATGTYESADVTDTPGNAGYTHSFVPVSNATAVLSLANQSATNWTDSAAISGVTTNVPSTARGWLFWVSISSTTAGARFYLVSEDYVPSIGNRDTDTHVQYIEAQVSGRTNTMLMFIAASASTPDKFAYAIEDGGVTDTTVAVRLAGFYVAD